VGWPTRTQDTRENSVTTAALPNWSRPDTPNSRDGFWETKEGLDSGENGSGDIAEHRGVVRLQRRRGLRDPLAENHISKPKKTPKKVY